MKSNYINFIITKKSKFFLATVFSMLIQSSYTQTITVQVHNLTTPNSTTKSGYNLIWSDEFPGTSLSTSYWNKSTTDDDGTTQCERDLTMNPSNVSVEDGLAKLTINITDFAGCTGSCSEIKTFSIVDNTFIDYYFNDPCYLEIRVKYLPFKTGLGSAAWVYNCDAPEYSEIDIWETDGIREERFTATYHWQEGSYVVGCSDNEYEVRRRDAKDIKVKNLDDPTLFGYKDLDLSNNWLIYGIEWDGNYVKWYLNNVLARTIDLSSTPPEGTAYHSPTGQLTLRIGTGNNSVGNTADTYSASDLPKTMQIDYVRAYVKDGSKACPITRVPKDVCNYTGDIIATNYLPGVTYSWTSSGFDFGVTDNNIPSEKWMTPKTGVTLDQSYTVTLVATFPSGYTETSTASVYLPSGIPATPSNSVTTTRIGTSCYYWAKTKKNNANDVILWSETGTDPFYGGFEYYSGGFYYSRSEFEYDPAGSYSVKLKAKNDCGTSSASSWKNFTTPDPPAGCMYRLASDSDTTSEELSDNIDIFSDECIINAFVSQSKFIISIPENCSNEKYLMKIFNTFGQQLFISEITQSAELNLPVFPDGIYLGIISTENGNIVSTTKFYR